jgi:hypothetical protein
MRVGNLSLCEDKNLDVDATIQGSGRLIGVFFSGSDKSNWFASLTFPMPAK